MKAEESARIWKIPPTLKFQTPLWARRPRPRPAPPDTEWGFLVRPGYILMLCRYYTPHHSLVQHVHKLGHNWEPPAWKFTTPVFHHGGNLLLQGRYKLNISETFMNLCRFQFRRRAIKSFQWDPRQFFNWMRGRYDMTTDHWPPNHQ